MEDGRDRARAGTTPRGVTGGTATPDPVPGARDGRRAEADAPAGASEHAESTQVMPADRSGGADAGAPGAAPGGGSAGNGSGERPSGSRVVETRQVERSPELRTTEHGTAADGPGEDAAVAGPGSSDAADTADAPADDEQDADLDGGGTAVLPVDSGRTGGGRTGGGRPALDGPTTHIQGARGGARPASGASAPGRGPRPPADPRGRSGSGRGQAPGGGRPQRSSNGEPLPGTMIVDRYRLVAEVGRDERAGAALWKARDVMLERDVAITLLTGGWRADARASSALSRATRSAHFEHANAARVLDVVHPGAGRLPAGILGAAVAEWTPGRDLAELVSGGALRPSAALRVVEPLAAAVAEAHRSGLVLGLEHPRRIRVGSRTTARLAFPMPRGDATVDDDVHGLGAALYLLLTARWPSDDGQAPAGLTAAPRLASGGPVPVRQLRPDLPVELAALVDRTLDADGGIRTAAAVHRLASGLRERLDDDGVLLPVTEDGEPIDESSAVWQAEDDDTERRDPATRRKLRIGVTLLILATLAIVAFVAFQLVSLVGVGGDSSAPPLVIPATTTAARPAAAPSAASPSAAAPAPAAPAPGGVPVQLSSVAVYDPSGGPDNPTRVNRAVDGDPTTTWSTSDYRQQLPSLKPGIGVMTTLSAPTAVTAVSVVSPSPGTRVEVRSAPTADVPLSQTQLLGAGTVTGNQLVIGLPAAPPTRNVLIWVTALGRDGSAFNTQLGEVTVLRAG